MQAFKVAYKCPKYQYPLLGGHLTWAVEILMTTAGFLLAFKLFIREYCSQLEYIGK